MEDSIVQYLTLHSTMSYIPIIDCSDNFAPCFFHRTLSLKVISYREHIMAIQHYDSSLIDYVFVSLLN